MLNLGSRDVSSINLSAYSTLVKWKFHLGPTGFYLRMDFTTNIYAQKISGHFSHTYVILRLLTEIELSSFANNFIWFLSKEREADHANPPYSILINKQKKKTTTKIASQNLINI